MATSVIALELTPNADLLLNITFHGGNQYQLYINHANL